MNEILKFQLILNELNEVVCRAGRTIMKYYGMKEVKSKIKYDGTPVTEADIESERIIISSLKSFTPQIPIISEEQTDERLRTRTLYDGNDNETRTFWLVDPLDGTEIFMRKEDRFTINIGLVQNSKPALGMIYFPASDILYSGISGHQAQVQSKASRRVKFRPVQIKSRSCGIGDQMIALLNSGISDVSKLDILLRKVKIFDKVIGNNSHKLCGVAAGEIEVSTIMRSFEWDTAAGHAILKGAGGNIIDISGKELHYGKPAFKNPALIAHGRISECQTISHY
jgi:3'(2'), 5'-bisphosphate nucleotidase